MAAMKQFYQPSILLFKGRGFISRAIRWQTRGQYSHAALLQPNGTIIEAWQGNGVRIKAIVDWRDVDVFYVDGMTEQQWEAALSFARKEVGCGYDYWGVIRFVSRSVMPKNNKWFCSELVFASLFHAGVLLLHRVNSSEVSPSMLSYSPLLIPANEVSEKFNY
jgi:uncharacterized protein YycO